MTTLELTRDEKSLYQEHKAFIKQHAENWIEVTRRLIEIRDQRLYLTEYVTFRDFCSAVLGKTDRRVRQLIQAVREVEDAVKAGGTVVPPTERAVRTKREAARRLTRTHTVPQALQLEIEPDRFSHMSLNQLVTQMNGIAHEITAAHKNNKLVLMQKLVTEGISVMGNLQRVLTSMQRSK